MCYLCFVIVRCWSFVTVSEEPSAEPGGRTRPGSRLVRSASSALSTEGPRDGRDARPACRRRRGARRVSVSHPATADARPRHRGGPRGAGGSGLARAAGGLVERTALPAARRGLRGAGRAGRGLSARGRDRETAAAAPPGQRATSTDRRGPATGHRSRRVATREWRETRIRIIRSRPAPSGGHRARTALCSMLETP